MLRYSLSLYRGDTYRWRFMLWADPDRTVAVDLTGVVVGAEIRCGTGTTPIYPLTIAVTLPNTIDLSLSAAASAIWDLQLTYPSGPNGANQLLVLRSGPGQQILVSNPINYGSFANFTEMAAPANPAANIVSVYAEDNGSGKTRLNGEVCDGRGGADRD